MEGQTIAERTEQITYKGKTYSMGYGKLDEFFNVFDKIHLPCGLCKHVELTPTGFPHEYNRKCIYIPKDIEWKEIMDDDSVIIKDSGRCFYIDDKIKGFIEAGLFDDFLIE